MRDEHRRRLVAAGMRHHARRAIAAEADTAPGRSLGMDLVTLPAPTDPPTTGETPNG